MPGNLTWHSFRPVPPHCSPSLPQSFRQKPPEDIEKVSGAVNNCKDAAKNMADTMQDNLEGQLTILKSQLQELAISFGDLLMPAVRSIVSGLQGMVDVLNAMPDGVKQVIMIIALLNTTYMCYLQYSVFDYPCVGLV